MFLFKKYFKPICYAFIFILFIAGIFFFIFPFALSSDFTKNKIVSYLSDDLDRPVSIEQVKFSWNKGINVSGFNLSNQDGSPLIGFKNLSVKIFWPSVIFGNIRIDLIALNEINVTLVRDENGILNVVDLMPKDKKDDGKAKEKSGLKAFAGILLNAGIDKGNIRFIDRRLDTVTNITNLKADFFCRSLAKPIHIFIKCDISTDEKIPEPVEVKGTLRLATKGKLDLKNAQGFFDMKSGFGNLKAEFDLSKFNTTKKETGASVSCYLDLNKLLKMSAGLTGLPADFSIKGFIESDIKAFGNFANDISVNGKTVLKDIMLIGGPFKDTPFQNKRMVLTNDILVDYSSRLIDIKSLAFNSEMAGLAISGTISDFNKIPELDIIMSGTGDIKKISHVIDGFDFYPSDLKLSGAVTLSLSGKGNLKRSHVKGRVGFKNLLINKNKTGSDRSESILSLPEFLLTSDISYIHEQNRLTINSLEADTPFLHMSGSGSISELTRIMLVQLKGEFDFDSHGLQKILKDLWPEKLVAKGGGKVVFDFSAPLAPSEDASFFNSFKGTGSLFADSIGYDKIGFAKNIKSTKFFFENKIMCLNMESVFSNGSLVVGNVCDFNKKPVKINMDIKGAGIELAQNLKPLEYVLPFLNIQPSGRLSGKCDFSIHASCKGTDFESEIVKTLGGYGNISLKHGTVTGSRLLSVILKAAGESDTLAFEEIFTDFRLADGKIYNDNITVNGKALDLIVKGWTSLSYDPLAKGNPIRYTLEGDFFQKNLGRDAKKVLSFLGGVNTQVPFEITGTVQRPKVSIKKTETKELIKGIFDSIR